MSQRRERRSTAQPNNYKDFNEKGKQAGETSSEEHDNSRHEGSQRESEGESEVIINRRGNYYQVDDSESDNPDIRSRLRSSQKQINANGNETQATAKHDKHENSQLTKANVGHTGGNTLLLNTQDYVTANRGEKALHCNTKLQKYKHANTNKHNNSSNSIASNDTNASNTSIITGHSHHDIDDQQANAQPEQDRLLLTVNSDEDDLDGDTGGTTNTYHNTSSGSGRVIQGSEKAQLQALHGKYGGARPKSAKKDNNTQQVSPTPRKTKKSVATRLILQNSTKKDKGRVKINQGRLHDDDEFFAENEKAELELNNAKQMLIQSQRQAELAKKRLEAEEIRKQSLQVKKKAERDNKKADQEHARYVKQNFKVLPPAQQENKPEQTENEIMVANTKNRVRMLNPLRRARSTYVGTDGTNNPNLQGRDNGANAWLDVQLNDEEVDDDVRLQAKYAKRNSDRNRFFDIDDIPIRGPPCVPDDDIQSNISITDATEIANALLNDDDLYICSTSGIMRRRSGGKEKTERNPSPRKAAGKQPSSTVTRPKQPSQPEQRYNSHNSRYRNKAREPWHDDYYRYDYNDNDGWDTASETGSESPPPINKRRKNKSSKSQAKQLKNVPDCSGRQTNRSRSREQQYQRQRDTYTRDGLGYNSRRNHEDRDERRSRERGRNDIASSDSDNNKTGKKIKSGINAKPNCEVIEQKRYPQFSLGQVSGFVGQDIAFSSLTYEQFMAGELTTIINCHDPVEVRGRIEILQRVALWRMRANVTWPQVRGTYSFILRSIENQEISWTADWDRYERHIYEKIVIPNATNTGSSTTINKRPRNVSTVISSNDAVWFCKSYQRFDGCNKEAPHSAKIGNMFKQVQHICALCWLKDRVKRYHPECSPDCPLKES